MSWETTLDGVRVIIDLPSGDVDDLVAAGEVLVQEQLPVWALPADRIAELEPLRGVFGSRVRLAVSGLRTAVQVADAVSAGAELLLATIARPELLEAAHDVPIALGALTPIEVDDAVMRGATAVQVVPCDALGSLYANALPELSPGVALIATGRMERFQSEMWLQSGVLAVMPLGQISAEDAAESDLADLQRRAQVLAALG